jgi:haloalkane dehalogenase
MSASRNADWLDRKLFPYTQKRLELDGHELAYVDEGKGPPLLMLHGNPTWSFLYRDVIAGLRERFRCIAPDLPGFGFSTPAAGFGFRPSEHSQVIERFIEALDLRDITLMVHDWGGPIGFGAAGRNPERFSAVILANTFAWPVNGDFHVELASRLMGGPIGKLLITHANAFVNLLVPAGIRRGGPPPAVMAAYRGPFALRADRYPTYVFPREILKSRAFLAEVERGLTLLRDLPALILWGDRDIAFRDKERVRFEELFPKHRTVALEGAGHFVQEDAAPEIIEAVNNWVTHDAQRA